MSTQTQPVRQKSPGDWLTSGPLRFLVSIGVPVIAFLFLRWSFVLLRDQEANRILVAFIALTIGVFGVWILYLLTYYLTEQLPERLGERVRPFVFVGPAMVILFIFLLYPIGHTFYLSLMNADSEEFIGLKNYRTIFTDEQMLITLRNNGLWLISVPLFSVSFGLIVAVLVDRIGRWESTAKAFIFLPMAISAVGAGVVWKFMYFVRAEGEIQIGFLNAIITKIGGSPTNFLETIPLNNLALIIIMTWMVTGYCMVVISAGIKNVSTEVLEAARMDGANELQVFFRIIVPIIRPTLITVGTTVLIWVLKVFDIVYVMTNGRRDTQVVANQMYTELFRGGSVGLGSALAILLLVAVSPFIVSNVRELRRRRA
ncbi:MAG: sugar ABC transporter permease [Chloroflexi bacterium]|nr:sugar ABC transporter permease [Chloroflexota bacterium]